MIATGTPLIVAHHVRREHRVAEVGGLHVLRDELDLAGEVLLDDFLDALGAVGELPVPGHDVDAEELLRVDHVLALRPQRRRRALPRVAAVEQQRAGPRRPAAACTSVARCAKPPIVPYALRRALEVEIGERVRLARARRDAEVLQQRLADEMRRLARRRRRRRG